MITPPPTQTPNRATRRAQARANRGRTTTRSARQPKGAILNAHEIGANWLRTMQPHELVDLLTKLRLCHDALRRGMGTLHDVDELAYMVNTGLILAERATGPGQALASATFADALQALVRLVERTQQRGLGVGYDAAGLQAVGAALDAIEVMLPGLNPRQVVDAIEEMQRRAGDPYRVDMRNRIWHGGRVVDGGGA